MISNHLEEFHFLKKIVETLARKSSKHFDPSIIFSENLSVMYPVSEKQYLIQFVSKILCIVILSYSSNRYGMYFF